MRRHSSSSRTSSSVILGSGLVRLVKRIHILIKSSSCRCWRLVTMHQEYEPERLQRFPELLVEARTAGTLRQISAKSCNSLLLGVAHARSKICIPAGHMRPCAWNDCLQIPHPCKTVVTCIAQPQASASAFAINLRSPSFTKNPLP